MMSSYPRKRRSPTSNGYTESHGPSLRSVWFADQNVVWKPTAVATARCTAFASGSPNATATMADVSTCACFTSVALSEEAILWHGGKAKHAKEAFRTMINADRDALVAVLSTL